MQSAAAAMPAPLLSQAAERLTLEDLEALERAAKVCTPAEGASMFGGHLSTAAGRCSASRAMCQRAAGAINHMAHSVSPLLCAAPLQHMPALSHLLTSGVMQQALSCLQAYVLQLADVTPQANLQYHFARWDGAFSLEGPRPDGSATVRFQRPEHLQEALNYFGGGLRGLFRLVHTKAPSKGVSVNLLPSFEVSICLVLVKALGGGVSQGAGTRFHVPLMHPTG